MKKMIKVIVITIVVLFAMVLLFKDVLIKATAPSIASSVLGTKVTLGSFHLGLLSSHLVVRDLVVFSPEGFGTEPLLDLAKLDVRYDLMSLIKRQNHFKLIDIDFRRVVLVKNTDGQYNAQALKPVKEAQDSSAATQGTGQNQSSPKSNEMVNLSIDELKVNIDQVMVNQIKSNGAIVQDLSLSLRGRSYKDIRSVNDLIVKVIGNEAGLLTITNSVFFAGHEFKKGVGFLVDTTGGVVKEAGGILRKITSPLLK